MTVGVSVWGGGGWTYGRTSTIPPPCANPTHCQRLSTKKENENLHLTKGKGAPRILSTFPKTLPGKCHPQSDTLAAAVQGHTQIFVRCNVTTYALGQATYVTRLARHSAAKP